MRGWSKKLSLALVMGGAAIALTAAPAAASGGANPRTGCIGGNNMMPAPGMSTQGWAALPESNPGVAASGNGMVTAMIDSDPLWPDMGC